MSATSTRPTPSGSRVSAAISAKDCGFASQSTAMRYLSCPANRDSCNAAWLATRTASIGMSRRGSVRPRVTAYGRTRLPLGSCGCPTTDHPLPALGRLMAQGLTRGGCQRGADPLHEQRHLVADLADVAAAGREHGHRRAVADGHQEEVSAL